MSFYSFEIGTCFILWHTDSLHFKGLCFLPFSREKAFNTFNTMDLSFVSLFYIVIHGKNCITQQWENKGTKTMITDDGSMAALSQWDAGSGGGCHELDRTHQSRWEEDSAQSDSGPTSMQVYGCKICFLRNRIFTFLGKNSWYFSCQLQFMYIFQKLNKLCLCIVSVGSTLLKKNETQPSDEIKVSFWNQKVRVNGGRKGEAWRKATSKVSNH